jgi:hypothetical protein
VRNWHRHAIEQVSRRWRGGGRDDSARTRRQISISTQVTSLAQSLANDAAANPRAPKPVKVTFSPKRNVRYCSRFRFDVHHGESFDVVLQGAGSYEEDVLPRHVRVAGRNR